MSLGRPAHAVFLQPSSSGVPSANRPLPPSSIHIHPLALFSILDHHLRRDTSQSRVIGTLLGTRSSSSSSSDGGGGQEIEVKTAFAVLHAETAERVAVDMDYHRTMLDLHLRINPREGIVGWYSTGPTLNTYSALIQGFYQQETAPHQAIHLSFDTDATDGELGVKTYLSAPVGVNPKPENCLFTPVPCTLRYSDIEKGGLDLLLTSSLSPTHLTPPLPELPALDLALTALLAQLDRVLSYVRSVLSGERRGDPVIGRFLLETLSRDVGGVGEVGGKEGRLQDELMVGYLAALVRSQVEVAARLALIA